jgi:GGDEF domain-containing protein
VSVGLAVAEPHDDAATLLRRADQAMYRAKIRRRDLEPAPDDAGPVAQTWVER